MKYLIIKLFVFIVFNNCLLAQSVQTSKKGIVIYNKPIFKYFAILMVDTLASGNRFDNWFAVKVNNEYSNEPFDHVKLPALIIDSLLFMTCEKKLLSPNSLVTFYNYPGYPVKNNKLKNDVAKYIRLYIGFIDMNGDKKVVVQFITLSEFKRYRHIFSKELFLIVNQKYLRFAVIQL